jgi:hypothetical protein
MPANIVRPQDKPLQIAVEVMAPCVMKSGDYHLCRGADSK